MSQITSGVRHLLSSPIVYSFFQHIVGGNKGKGIVVGKYLRPERRSNVLEIGCGPGDYSEYFGDETNYTGFDLSQLYIDNAKRKYSPRKNLQFICADVNHFAITELNKFDICFAAGLLHHLNDNECSTVFKMAHSALKEGGRCITIDPVFVEGQSTLAKYIVSWDRGQNIRRPMGYQNLANSAFESVKTSIRHDLLRIPYSHIIMECTR